jgi:hypothetical protein
MDGSGQVNLADFPSPSSTALADPTARPRLAGLHHVGAAQERVEATEREGPRCERRA